MANGIWTGTDLLGNYQSDCSISLGKCLESSLKPFKCQVKIPSLPSSFRSFSSRLRVSFPVDIFHGFLPFVIFGRVLSLRCTLWYFCVWLYLTFADQIFHLAGVYVGGVTSWSCRYLLLACYARSMTFSSTRGSFERRRLHSKYVFLFR